MIRTIGGLVAVVLATQAANAQSSSLNDTQLQGRALFNQSCRVCHTPPTINAPLYGPALTQDTQRGRDDVLAEIIAEGSPHMPGFKYQFGPDQITAIVAYLRTVPAQPQSASSSPAAPPASRNERERQQREAD